MEVEYEQRDCDEKTQFRWEIVDKSPEPNNCDQFEMERIIDAQILNDDDLQLMDVPLCDDDDPEAFKIVEKYTTRDCIFVNRCSDEFTLDEPLDCDDGTTWGEQGDEINCSIVKGREDCGSSCCRDEFRVCESEETEQIIMESARQAASVSECSNPPSGIDPNECASCINPPR